MDICGCYFEPEQNNANNKISNFTMKHIVLLNYHTLCSSKIITAKGLLFMQFLCVDCYTRTKTLAD